jgi:hypothetical protein
VNPELDRCHSAVSQLTLEGVDLRIGASALHFCTEALNALNSYASVPAAVEDEHLLLLWWLEPSPEPPGVVMGGSLTLWNIDGEHLIAPRI